MKQITNNSPWPLPLPDGRKLRPGVTTYIEDSQANGDRVQAWLGTGAVSLAEVENREAEITLDQAAFMTIKHKGGGKYAIVKDDLVMMGGLTKAEAEEFQNSSPEDRLAWLTDVEVEEGEDEPAA